MTNYTLRCWLQHYYAAVYHCNSIYPEIQVFLDALRVVISSYSRFTLADNPPARGACQGDYGLPPIGLARENRNWVRCLESEI